MDFSYYCIVFLLSFVFDEIEAQASAYYRCVAPSVCPGGVPSDPGIDPRIVTPGGGGGGVTPPGQLCPTGQVACYGQSTLSKCGMQLVAGISTVPDGTAQQGAYPWLAYMSVGNYYIGAGVLLNNYNVLTAAHRVINYQSNPSQITVTMGVYTPNNLSGTQSASVTKILFARDYNNSTLINDLAILQLATPIPLGTQTNINTACLPDTAGKSYVGQNCVVAGWGQTGFTTLDAPTNPIKQVTVPIVSIDVCYASYSNASLLGTNVAKYLDRNGEICAGGQAMRDACTYDGGAPLVCLDNGRYTIAGLVIWGKNCGQANVYGVYVSVPYYLNRILSALVALGTNVATAQNF